MLNLMAQWNQPCRGLTGSAELHLGVRLRPQAPTRGVPVHVLILLDVSGSMEGTKIDHARQAVASVWGQLRPGDRLCVVSFATRTTLVRDWVEKGRDSDALIRDAVNGCTPGGITLLLEALAEGRRRMSDCPATEPRFIWLVTDGQPTNARGAVMEDLSSYLDTAGEIGTSGVTLGALGLGDAENYRADFLTDLADRGRGGFCYAPRPADLEDRLQAQLADAKAVSCVNARLTVELQSGCSILSAARIVPEYCPLDLAGSGGAWSFFVGAISAPETVVMLEVAANAPFGITPGAYTVGSVEIQAEVGDRRVSDRAALSLEFAAPGSRRIYERDATIDNWRVVVEMARVEAERSRAKDVGDLARLTAKLSELASDAGNQALAERCNAQLGQIQSQGGLSRDELARSSQNVRQSGRFPVT